MQTAAVSPLESQQENIIHPDMAEKLRNELELLDYVIAHDVQASLRMILSCSEELNQHHCPVFDEAGYDVVQTLNHEAERMKALVQGVLDYIRLQTFATTSILLDSTELVHTAISMLQDEIKTTGAVITFDALPKVMGHRGRLTRLFAHLLDNAIKFHGEQLPKIYISAKRGLDNWEFCIEDNGIGIDKEHYTNVFGLFQRLHSASSCPGHGIGLALSRKIVEAHNGKLWVESTQQKGSRFYFTLPVVPTNE